MSKITKWAWEQQLPATEKYILIALAHRANTEHKAFPCANTLAKDTGLNIKTIKSLVIKIRDRGLITDTGERTGKTKQVIVYKVGPYGTKQTQKRTCLTGPVANPLSQSERGPKTGHGSIRIHREESIQSKAVDFSTSDGLKKLRLVAGGRG